MKSIKVSKAEILVFLLFPLASFVGAVAIVANPTDPQTGVDWWEILFIVLVGALFLVEKRARNLKFLSLWSFVYLALLTLSINAFLIQNVLDPFDPPRVLLAIYVISMLLSLSFPILAVLAAIIKKALRKTWFIQAILSLQLIAFLWWPALLGI